jgi:hypothetical protein
MTESQIALVEAYEKGYRISLAGKLITPRGKIRNHGKLKTGYFYFRFRSETLKKVKNVKLHRLAAYQKYGYALFEIDCVRHLDGNPENNCLENIGLGTLSENQMDISLVERADRAKHAASFIRKLSPDQVKQLRRDRDSGLALSALAESTSWPSRQYLTS